MTNQIQRLISEIYYLKIEINASLKTYSAMELQDMSELRIKKKSELNRLIALRERKEKITKIKSKI